MSKVALARCHTKVLGANVAWFITYEVQFSLSSHAIFQELVTVEELFCKRSVVEGLV